MRIEKVGILDIEVRASQTPGSKAMIVRGVAATFNQPTVLYEVDGIQYKEQIASGAFDKADMMDIVFLYGHTGRVMARTRNDTLRVWVERDGLHIWARLDGTEEGRRQYEEIQGGYIDKMSYAYSVDEESYDAKTRTRTISKIKRVYDVSAVAMPAYESTSIWAYDETQERARLLSQINGDDRRKNRRGSVVRCQRPRGGILCRQTQRHDPTCSSMERDCIIRRYRILEDLHNRERRI